MPPPGTDAAAAAAAAADDDDAADDADAAACCLSLDLPTLCFWQLLLKAAPTATLHIPCFS